MGRHARTNREGPEREELTVILSLIRRKGFLVLETVPAGQTLCYSDSCQKHKRKR